MILDNDPDNTASGSFRIVGVPEGTDVTATVNGVNCSNITSTVTSPACGLPAPGNFTQTSLSVATQLFPRVTWTASTNADSYTVQLSVAGGNFQDRATVNNTTFGFTDTVAVFGQSLTYRIKATNTSGSTLSNTLSVTPPAVIERLVLSYNCFDPATNELVWDVQNPNIQNIPFIYAQWWSPQRDTLIAPNRNTSNFRTLRNSQNAGTPGDDNITGIWWIDETLSPDEPNDIVFTGINLSNTCPVGRTTNPAQQAPLWMAKAVGGLLQIPTSVDDADVSALLTVGPNPFTDVIFIEASELGGDASIKIFDMTGREVYNGQINLNYRSEIQIPGLQSGVYMLQVGDRKGANTVKIVKQ